LGVDALGAHHVERVPDERSFLLALVSGLCLIAGPVAAGPLNPPAGPVTSTYKALAEVELRIAINAVNTAGDVNHVYRISLPKSPCRYARALCVLG
jgi:hypothetical protein